MLYAIVAVIILIIDQATKYWASTNLMDTTVSLIPGVVQLTYVQNTGAAFGLLKDGRWFFVILTIAVAIAAIVLIRKNIIKGKLGRWMIIMVIAGGLGNCIDRIMNGYVVDMFQFQFMNFAIFNVADIFITVCGIIFCIYLIVHKEPMEEPAPVTVKAPSRPIPKATERPLRNADYISLLKKPVVEGRKNIEAEVTAKNAETPPVRSPEIGFTDWNTPNFEKAEVKSPETSSAPLPKPKASEPEKPEITPESKASDSDEIFKKPANISETDFSLEDILEEFRDK